MEDQIQKIWNKSFVVQEGDSRTRSGSLVKHDILWLNRDQEDLGKISGHVRVCNVTEISGMHLHEDCWFLHLTHNSSTIHEMSWLA